MPDLPKSILGEITAITITTPDPDKSLAYYQKLGFSLLMQAEWPFPWIQVSDGVLLIMLRKDHKPYLALTYYSKDIAGVTKDLEHKGIKFTRKPQKGDMIKRYLFQSPDGLNISLVNFVDGFAQPPGPGMLQMKEDDYFKPAKYVNKTCGLFGEIAHPVKSLDRSIEFWAKLGFKPISKFESPYPWAIVSDGLATVGLHQTDHFNFPAITYFASDMGEKIAKLKKSGLKNYTAQGDCNAILTTPEQQHIFLYHLGGMGGPEKKKKNEITAPITETKRLLLKELNPEIMNELFTTYSDEDIITFLGLRSEDELHVEKNKWQQGLTTYRMSFKRFLIIEKNNGEVIGSCGFHNWYAEHQRAELGYNISNEAKKGEGFMKEALKAVITHGFEKMGLNRIEALISPGNVPSLKLVKGFGFTEEGTLRSHYCVGGKTQDSVCFSLLKPEYRKLKKTWST